MRKTPSFLIAAVIGSASLFFVSSCGSDEPEPGPDDFKNITITVKGQKIEMVAVEGGTFSMGATAEQASEADSYEKPVHSVTLSDFYICKYEVTQELWKAIMGSNPSRFSGDNLPAEQISWVDCQKFIAKLNELTKREFRLPTESEWEYAARGGKKSKGYKYAGSNNVDNVAWYESNCGTSTHKVGSKASNELGLYDMSGNVWEWCQDLYGQYPSEPQTNPSGPSSGTIRIFRGGGVFAPATQCRVAKRAGNSDDYSHYNLGLRLALPR